MIPDGSNISIMIHTRMVSILILLGMNIDYVYVDWDIKTDCLMVSVHYFESWGEKKICGCRIDRYEIDVTNKEKQALDLIADIAINRLIPHMINKETLLEQVADGEIPEAALTMLGL